MHHKVVGNFGSEADVRSLYFRGFRFNETSDAGAYTHGRPAKQILTELRPRYFENEPDFRPMHTKFECLLSKSLTTLEVMTYYLVVHTATAGLPAAKGLASPWGMQRSPRRQVWHWRPGDRPSLSRQRGLLCKTWGRYHGGRRPSSDDSFHSPTVIPPSAREVVRRRWSPFLILGLPSTESTVGL